MTEIEIGRGKRGRRAYSFDDIAVVPSRRTRDPEEVSVSWQIDAYHFDIPVIAAPMDSVMSPESAIALGRLGGLPVLDLEGLWTRYEDPTAAARGDRHASTPALATVADAGDLRRGDPARARSPSACARSARPGSRSPARSAPQRTQQLWKTVVDAGVDLFVIRGTTVSAEHVSGRAEPLNLKRFIYELDVPVIVGGAASYTAALHLMRTGAAGVLVGFGGGAAHTTRRTLGIHAPMASAIADVAAARRDYLDESGGRYVHVIADGGVGTQRRHRQGGRLRRRRRDARCRARPRDRRPGPRLPLGARGAPPASCPAASASRWARWRRLEEILFGPGRLADGTTNLVGALRARHGHDRLLRPQGVPAGRGRRRPLPAQLRSGRRGAGRGTAAARLHA